MRALRFVGRTSDQRTWNLASWHSPHSMTWRWVISFSFFKADEWRVRPLWFSHRNNHGLQWGFRIPFIGILHFSQQRPMWFRDLYYAKRDELEKERAEAAVPSRGRSPFQPTVIDGGQSIH